MESWRLPLEVGASRAWRRKAWTSEAREARATYFALARFFFFFGAALNSAAAAAAVSCVLGPLA